MIYLVDTNVLLRWSDSGASEHERCRDALSTIEEQGATAFVCAQTLIEYYAVATRPMESNGLGFTVAVAHENLLDILRVLDCLSEPANIAEKWLDLVTTNRVIGKQAHDARLVALMLAHDVTRLLTLNPSDFTRYQAITPVTPDEILHPETT